MSSPLYPCQPVGHDRRRPVQRDRSRTDAARPRRRRREAPYGTGPSLSAPGPRRRGYAGQDLLAPSPATGQVRLRCTTDVGLIHLYHPGHGRSRPGRTSTARSRCSHRPRRLIGTQRFPTSVSGGQCRPNPVLDAGEQPAGVEPNRQRRSRTVADRARGHRGTDSRTRSTSVGRPPRRVTRHACVASGHRPSTVEARRPPQLNSR